MNKKYKNYSKLPFANLPKILKLGVEGFQTKHEKIIFLYGAIVALSGLCFRVRGEYRRQCVYPNLFLFVLAQFATGKSALNYARKLVSKIHNEITEDSKKLLRQYLQQIKMKNGNTNHSIDKPPMKVVLIPANVTSAKLIEHLTDNDGSTPSIMIESEIDTLSIAAKSEHGNFSDILRKSFHNEPISYSRKGNNEFLEVKNPILAIALAGTINQFRRLVTNSEDGLFSRFLVYNFNAPQKWSSVTPCKECHNLDEIFEKLSDVVYSYYQYLRNVNLTIQLSSQQWQRLNQFGVNNLNRDLPGNSSGIIKRHALMIYKICLILTAIESAEVKSIVTNVECSDSNFNLALWLCKQSLENSLVLLNTLPNTNLLRGKESRIELYDHLPSEFARKAAILLGQQRGLTDRTIDRILSELVYSGRLKRLPHGEYKKL
jgi:hypothetical protein